MCLHAHKAPCPDLPSDIILGVDNWELWSYGRCDFCLWWASLNWSRLRSAFAMPSFSLVIWLFLYHNFLHPTPLAGIAWAVSCFYSKKQSPAGIITWALSGSYSKRNCQLVVCMCACGLCTDLHAWECHACKAHLRIQVCYKSFKNRVYLAATQGV